MAGLDFQVLAARRRSQERAAPRLALWRHYSRPPHLPDMMLCHRPGSRVDKRRPRPKEKAWGGRGARSRLSKGGAAVGLSSDLADKGAKACLHA